MKEKNQKKPAVILGMSANGLSVARSLGRKGVPVVGVESFQENAGLKSRYVKKPVISPDVRKEDEFLSFLIELGRKIGERPVLITTADEYISFVSNYREKLSEYFEFLLPSKEIVDCFLDKQRTSEFAVKNNIPHPNTYIIGDHSSLESVISKVKYPCILKPQDSHLWREKYGERKAFVTNGVDELKETFGDIKEHSLNVMLQEIVPGPDSNVYVYLAYCDRDSRILASFCGRKVRQYPPHFGIASLSESIYEPAVIELGENILSKMNYEGMICVECKMDSGTGRPVFIENNLRTVFIGELCVASGVDFPFIMYDYLANGNSKKLERGFKEGVKLVNMDLDLGSLSRMKKKREITVFQWLKGFKARKIAHTYFAIDDLKPFWFIYSRFLKNAVNKLKKMVNRPKTQLQHQG